MKTKTMNTKASGVNFLWILRALSASAVAARGEYAPVAQTRVAPSEAGTHIGEEVTVCGTVASVNHESPKTGVAAFLNLDARYPNPAFRIAIPAGANPADIDSKYVGKHVCIKGEIKKRKESRKSRRRNHRRSGLNNSLSALGRIGGSLREGGLAGSLTKDKILETRLLD